MSMLAVVLHVLFSRIDVATKALADRLQRYREARWVGVGWIDALRASGLPLIAGGAALTEEAHTGEFVVAEAPGKISRDVVTVTVPATTKYKPGLVLGKITATGKYVAYNNVAADGSEVAAAILYDVLDNETGGAVDFTATVINWTAEVRASDLDWNGQAQGAIDAGLADLATKGIKAR